MAKVKCVYCAEKIERDTAFKRFKTLDSKRFSYFCSEHEYNLYIKMQEEKLAELEERRLEEEKRKELISYVVEEFLDYEEGMVFPTFIHRAVKDLSTFYTYPMMKEAIKRGEESIRWAMENRDFEDDTRKLQYIMAVCKGNINNVYKEWKQAEEFSKNKAQKNEEVAMFEVETVKYRSRKSTKDISAFLSEEDI